MPDYFEKYTPPTKDEEEKAWRYKNEKFSTMYEEDDEEDLYKTARVIRKEDWLKTSSYKPEKAETYKSLIINKPRENTPASEAYTTYWQGSLAPSKEIEVKEEAPKKWMSLKDFTGAAIDINEEAFKKTTGKALKTVAQVVDKVDDTIIKKGVGSISVLWAAWYFNLKELWSSFREDREFDFLKAWKSTEEFQTRTEYLWWTNLSMNDYLNMDTATEKRRKQMEKTSWTLEADLKNIDKYTIIPDMTAAVLTWLWTEKALMQSAVKVWIETLAGKTLLILNKTINPSLTNMAKLGVWVWAVAWPYYALTWKWLWEDDPQATEWATMFLTSLWIKLSPKAIKGGYEAWKQAYDLGKWWVEALFKNKEVQKWVQMFSEEFKKLSFEWVEKFAKFSWAKLPFVEEGITKAVKETASDPIKEASEVAIVKKMREESIKRASKKTIKEWFIEKKAKNLWMWDDKKSKVWNTWRYIVDRNKSKIIKNENKLLWRKLWDYSVDRKFNKANRQAEKQLFMQQTFGKASRVSEDMEAIAKAVWSDYADFNQYLWEKSRYNKAIAQGERWKRFSTVQIFDNWAKADWTPERLKMSFMEREWKYKELAERVQRPNNQILDLEVEAWVRTAEEVASFKKSNPLYIPDKWEIDWIENALKEDNFWQLVKLGKRLGEWVEDVELSKNSMENLAKSMAYRARVAMNSKLANTALELDKAWSYWVVKEVSDKNPTRRWYAVIEAFKDGKKRFVEVPAFYKEAMEADDRLSMSTWRTILSTPTRMLKWYATWPLNVAFQAKAPIYEVPLGMFKNWANNWKIKDYLGSMFRTKNSFMNTPEGKIAINALLKDYWGDFTWAKLFQKEFDAFIKVDDKVWAKNWFIKSSIKKGTEFINSLWHNIEASTTRIPIAEAQIKKKWITWVSFQKLAKKHVKDWQTDVRGLTKDLITLWADPKEAVYTSRSLFDYNAASNQINNLSKYVPYLNIAQSNMVSLKNLFDDNPKKFMAWVWTVWLIAEAMYQYNYQGERWDILRKQSPYKRTKVWLVWVDRENEELEVFEVWRKIQMLEWMYPMVVSMHENGKVWKDSFNKMFWDVTYFGDLDKPVFFDPAKIPPWIKQGLELTMNKDFFRDKDLISAYDKRRDETEKYNKHTNPLYIKAAKAWALMTWWEANETWIIEWGKQISPIYLEKMFETIDPMWTAADWLAIAINKITNIWVTETNVKWLQNLFKKVYKLQDVTPDEDLEREESFAEQTFTADHRGKIRGSLDKANTMDELLETSKELLEEYKGYQYYDSDYKKILQDEIKDKQTKLKHWTQYFYFTKMSADKIGQRFARILQDEWIESTQKQFKKLKSSWILSESKMKNIAKEFGRIVQEHNISLK